MKLFPFGFRELCREEEDEGGGSAFTNDFDYWIYLSLSAFAGRDSNHGCEIIDAFRILDRETKSQLKIRYPTPSNERKFRSELIGAIDTSDTDGFHIGNCFALVLKCPVERITNNDAKLIIDIEQQFGASDNFNLRSFHKALERLVDVLDGAESLEGLAHSKSEKSSSWFDAIELKPGLFGFRIDLKKLFGVVRKH